MKRLPCGDCCARRRIEISGLPEPALAAPAAPTLLPIKSAANISWQGSVGATSYDVERAPAATGPWVLAGKGVDDTWMPYRSLFSDIDAKTGSSNYYRVLARNAAGVSVPSNVIGPVRVDDQAIVDELSDYTRSFAHGGELVLETANARAYKEDAHRLKGNDGSWITYRTAQPLRSVRVLVFMEPGEKDFEFFVSGDGRSFGKVSPKVSPFPTAVNPYGYKLPIQYELNNLGEGQYFIKVLFKTAAQISRVELRSGK